MITGQTLRDAILSGANNIANQRTRVDELNVFPVPDGDTGTNMSMTIGAARAELEAMPDSCTVAEASKTAPPPCARRPRQLRRYHEPFVPRLFQGAEGQDRGILR